MCTWQERKPDGNLSIVMNIRFARIERPRLTKHQILLPLQAQQLSRSYNGDLIVDVDITIRSSSSAAAATATAATAVGGSGPPPPPPTYEHQADVRGLCVGEIPVLVGSALCHRPVPHNHNNEDATCYFIVKGQPKVIVSQERLINNHPLISVSVLQSKQVQFTCEVRSVPATNTNRFPVIFALRTTMAGTPSLLPAPPLLPDPIIVTLTYFREEVPVILLFYAFGVFDLDAIGVRVQRTARWADLPTIQRLMYATIQHTAAVRTRGEALMVLSGFMAQHQQQQYANNNNNSAAARKSASASASASSSSTSAPPAPAPAPAVSSSSPSDAAEELLFANVLPHLTSTDAKLEYLAYLIGLLLNHLFLPSARRSNLFDKDHMGNKRLDVCGTLLSHFRIFYQD